MTPVDISAQWTKDWLSASVVSHTITTEPTVLRRHTCSLLNRVWTSQGLYHANLCTCGLVCEYD